jgi:hypothetical protein
MGDIMWEGFSDLELAHLAAEYKVADQLVFNDRLQLVNRARIESLLTEIEYNFAFSVDINYEVVV